jgi:3-hydroxypropionyl-CoA synthetase (ADP-forming)
MTTVRLADYGFTRPRASLATTLAEARRHAARIGYPVVLKIASDDIVHKIDVGGVAVNLQTPGELEAAYHRVIRAVRRRAPQANVKGVVVEQMCRGGHEVVIGLLNDPQFGPAIMFGLGGTFVEVIQDVSFRLLPLRRRDAQQMITEIKASRVLDGYRGLPRVSADMLVRLLLGASRLAMDIGGDLESVDLNPVMVWENDHRVLDAKILLSDRRRPVSLAIPNTTDLDRYFEARSVAVVGASSSPGKIGNSVMDSLACHDFRGRVYPVNPSGKEILGLRSYPSVSSLPEPVDLVVVTVPLSSVPEILGQCASRGIRNMVIVSGGGKELGATTGELEAEIAQLSRETGVRVIGPNCIGIFDGRSRIDTFFQVRDRMIRPPSGPMAIFSQSGTVGAALLEKAETLGVSLFASYGNRVDVDESDLLAYAAEDAETHVIACYVEGLADGRKFANAALRVALKKPVIVFKGGQSERGARASISHTGFFGGSYALFAGAMRQSGVTAVDSIEELFAAAKSAALQPRARGSRIAMISNGAGTMVQAIDLLEAYGLMLEALEPRTALHLRSIYPPYYIVQNPIDVTGSATSEDYRKGIEALLNDRHVDIVMPWFVFQDTPLDEAIVEALASLKAAYDKPILCGAMGGPYTQKMSRAIEAVGVPVYGTVREWLAGAKGVARPLPRRVRKS